VSRKYKGVRFRYKELQEYKEYNREYENENRRSTKELWVGDSHGKLVIEEELEDSL
jgi:cell shape-determining protein MreC